MNPPQLRMPVIYVKQVLLERLSMLLISTGLDSLAALMIMRVLRGFSLEGKIVLSTM